MTITRCELLTARKGTIKEKWEREYEFRYIVECSATSDDPNVVLRDASVPQIGQVYVSDSNCRVRSVECESIEGDPKKYWLTVKASNVAADNLSDPASELPENRKPVISYRFDRVQEILDRPYDPNTNLPSTNAGHMTSTGGITYWGAMTNSKKVRFDIPPQVDKVIPVLSYEMYTTTLGSAVIWASGNFINTTTFSGAADLTLRLSMAGMDQFFENGKRYWRKIYELAYNADTWDRWILDQGYELDSTEGTYKLTNYDTSGNTTDAVRFLRLRVHKAVDFNTIADIAALSTSPEDALT